MPNPIRMKLPVPGLQHERELLTELYKCLNCGRKRRDHADSKKCLFDATSYEPRGTVERKDRRMALFMAHNLPVFDTYRGSRRCWPWGNRVREFSPDAVAVRVKLGSFEFKYTRREVETLMGKYLVPRD